jgi:hypothetical protein|tara:strand:+ start:4836 stop:5567 length:732 start_codon:yes stop_codon:yes gene_type:complete
MARISTYANATSVVAADKWIGTDSKFLNATKNFTAQSVADFLNLTARIELNVPRFKYQFVNAAVPGQTTRNPGSLTFNPQQAGVINFNTVTSFVLSPTQVGRPTVDISSYYVAPLVDSTVIISKCSDISQWGIFKWNTATKNVPQASFTTITLTHTASNGGFEKDEDYFISLLDYGVSGDANKVVQLSPANAVFVVTHNLGKLPSVSVIDTANEQVECEVTYNSINQCTLTFNDQFSGQVTFN